MVEHENAVTSGSVLPKPCVQTGNKLMSLAQSWSSSIIAEARYDRHLLGKYTLWMIEPTADAQSRTLSSAWHVETSW